MDLCRPTISISWLRSKGRMGGHAMVSRARAGLVQFRVTPKTTADTLQQIGLSRASSVLASIAPRHCERSEAIQPSTRKSLDALT